jgi:hypothetical protein
MKKILFSAIFVAYIFNVHAQSGTNSPYSQYGFGTLAEQSSVANRGMGGVGMALRDGAQINILNPASYSAIDSLTFIFDVAMSGQITSFEEKGKRLNAQNANLEYAIAGFRLMKHLGLSFGILPYSNVGYSYSSTNKVFDSNDASYTNAYNGSGGFHQLYLGLGWEVFKGFSIGANGSYFWGNYEKSIVNSYSDSYANKLSKYYTASVTNFKVDFGAQATIPLSKKSSLTLGATYGLGHRLKADPECKVISSNTQSSVSDTASFVVKDGLELPTVIGGGMMLNLNNRWKFGADYQLQQWKKVAFPEYVVNNYIPEYLSTKTLFKDRHQINLGAEFCKNALSRRFFDRIRFRVGASYTTPYLNINEHEGPKEIGVSAGLGIPLVNGWNNRSILNISGQWVRRQANSLLKEDVFRINIGITFNERWFMKWKVD